MTFIIIMFLIAFALVIAEVMFPSFGMLGLLAAGAYLLAILEAFEYGQKQGVTAIVVAVILTPAAFALGVKLLQKSPIGNKLILGGPIRDSLRGSASGDNLQNLLGQSGKSLTPMRPSGLVDIGGTRVDAVSDGEFIEAGQVIKVIQIEGNQVVVALTTAKKGS